MIGRTNAGGGGGKAYAMIVADWPSGSTCQAVRSGDGKTLKAKGTSGHFVFNLPKPITAGVAETWTVSCTDGTDIASANVSITTEGQREEVALSYTIYLIQDGQLILTPTLTYIRTPTSSGGYVIFTANGDHYCLADFGLIDCTGKSELIIDVGDGSTSFINQAMMPSIGLSDSDSAPSVNQSSGAVSPYLRFEKMTGTSPNVTPGTYTVPLNYTGSKYIWFAFSGSAQGTRTMYISNFYVR